ncbi:MAG: FG-GAP-like repeat-containing protein [Candidatus Methanoperedens sp.]
MLRIIPMPPAIQHGNQEEEVTMKKLIPLLTMIFLVTTASAEIEQHQGFPVKVGDELQVPVLAQDINGDGKLEIIAVPQNRIVKVFYHNGTLNWENTGGNAQYDDGRVPLVSDLNGDGKLEIISYGNPGWSDATFYIWDAAGKSLSNFFVGKYLVISSPAITQDGTILTGAAPGVSFSAIVEGTGVHAFNSGGSKLWYLELGNSVNFFAQIQIADMDADGIGEAVILTQNMNDGAPKDGKVRLVKVNSAGGTILWSRETGGDARNAAIGDVNGDGRKEIVAVSSGGVYIFDRDGNVLNKFAINNNPDIPSIGDIDNNGVNEVLIASSESDRIYIISNGTLKEFSAERITSNIALADLNNDGRLELAGGDMYGNMYIWDNTGKVIEKRNIAKKYHYFISAIIADLEGDGNKEIILGNYDGNIHTYTYKGKPKDIIPPVTTDDVDGQWHNTSLIITLIPSDENSGIASTYYTIDGSLPTIESQKGTSIILSESGEYIIKYFSVDNAGNEEGVKTALNTAKIDTRQPDTTDNADSQWHNSTVTITLTAMDENSGVLATYYSIDGSSSLASPTNVTTITINSEGIHTLRYYSVDNAGNVEEPHEAVVKIDITPPVTADDSDNVWHNSDVILNLTATDSLSNVAIMHYTMGETGYTTNSNNIQLTFINEGIHNITYHSVDNSGNAEETKKTAVRIDRSAPVTTDDSDGEWHNNSVTVKLSSVDDLSGVKSTNYQLTPVTKSLIDSFLIWVSGAIGISEPSQGNVILLTDEGIFGIKYNSEDNVGNIELEKNAKQVKIDRTSPTITGSASPLPNAYGWYNSDVSVHFDCSDELSGVGSCAQDSVISAEGAGQKVSGVSIDKAGNFASTEVGGINIDKTQPVAAVSSPVSKTYLHSDIIKLVFSAQDSLSDISTAKSVIDGTREVTNGQSFAMLGLDFGTHEFTLTSEDNAGNTNSLRVSFNVIATIDSLQALTEQGTSGSSVYALTGSPDAWITNNGVANSLKAKINSARAKMNAGQNAAAKNILEAYINEVEAQGGKAIIPEGAGILKAEARYVIEHIFINGKNHDIARKMAINYNQGSFR